MDNSNQKLSYRRDSARPRPPINHNCQTRLPGLHFCGGHYGHTVAAVNLTHWAPKAAVLCEIMRNDDQWAVQGHPRSTTSVSQLWLPIIANLAPFRVTTVYWVKSLHLTGNAST